MSDPTIRAMTKADLPAVKALVDAAGLDIAGDIGALTADYLARAGSDGKKDGHSAEWLTCEQKGPVAVAWFEPEPTTEGAWNLRLTAVHPDHQGKGIGSLLVQHVEQELAERGARVLFVEVSSYDQFRRTRNFYRKIGYHEEARIREYYKAGEDKIIFRKSFTRT